MMEVRDFSVSFGSRTLYRDFSVSFHDGVVTVILGPSGCGKTTLLNRIALGDGGTRTSYIFQEPRLLPWYSLEKNIMLTLNGSAQERRERARHYLGKVGLAGRAAEYPENISGGERQRAAIARAFSYPAPVLLMDEPFQSQDPATKAQLIALVKALQADEHRTIIAVTHDVREASALADRAIILNGSPVSIILDIPIGPNFERELSEVLSCQTSIL